MAFFDCRQRRPIADGVAVSLRQKAIRGVAWTAVQNWGTGLIALFVFLILARLLGPEHIGEMTAAAAMIAVVAIVQQLGLVPALVQRENLEPEHINASFWTTTIVGVVLAGLVALFAPTITAVLHQPNLALIVRVMSLKLVFDGLATTPQALLRRRLDFRSLAVRSLLSAVLGGVVGIAMAVYGFGVWSLVAQQLVSSAVGLMTLWVASGFRPTIGFSSRHLRQLLGYSTYAMGADTVALFNNQLHGLLIPIFLGHTVLGYYIVGQRFVRVAANMFTATVAAVMLPTFSRLQQHLDQMRHAFLSATQMSALLAFPVFIGLAAVSKDLLASLFRDEWTSSFRVMQFLALAAVVQSISFFNRAVIMARGYPRRVLVLALINLTTNIVAFLVAVTYNDVAVLALAVMVQRVAYGLLPLLVVRGLIDLDLWIFVRQYLPPLAASLIMVAAVMLIKLVVVPESVASWVRLMVEVVVGAATYLLAIRLIAPYRVRQALEYFRLLRSGEPS